MSNESIQPFDVKDDQATHVIIEIFGGDNNLSDYVEQDMEEMEAGNSGPIVVLALADLLHDPASVVELSPRTGRNVIEKWGEIDTGDPETLARFLARALVSYGADSRKAIGFWDHGSGVFGEGDPQGEVVLDRRYRAQRSQQRPKRSLFFKKKEVLADARLRAMLHDDTNGGVLTNLEAKGVLTAAFKRAGREGEKVDLIFSDTCLNGMVEVTEQLQDFASCIVGSEDLEPGDGWEYDKWFKLMSDAPPTSPEAWGEQAVAAFHSGYEHRPHLYPCTLGAFLTTNQLAEAFKALIAVAGPMGEQGFFHLDRARRRSQAFARHDTYDIKDFAGKLAQHAPDGALKTAANDLLTAFDGAQVASVALGDDVTDAHGLAFWFPSNRKIFLKDVTTYERLDFSQRTGWADYLRANL